MTKSFHFKSKTILTHVIGTDEASVIYESAMNQSPFSWHWPTVLLNSFYNKKNRSFLSWKYYLIFSFKTNWIWMVPTALILWIKQVNFIYGYYIVFNLCISIWRYPVGLKYLFWKESQIIFNNLEQSIATLNTQCSYCSFPA